MGRGWLHMAVAFFDLIASRSVLERRKNTRPACVRIFILFFPLRIYDLGDGCLRRFCSTRQRIGQQIFLPRCSIFYPSCRFGYVAIFVGQTTQEGKTGKTASEGREGGSQLCRNFRCRDPGISSQMCSNLQVGKGVNALSES